MLDPVIVAAIVELLYQVCVHYLPQFPISKDLINSIVLFLLGLFAYKAAVIPAVRKLAPKLQEKGLVSEK